MIVDTSFLISLFLDDDSKHSEAKRLFLKCDETFIVPLGVFEEFFNVLTYKRGVVYALDSLDLLLCEKKVEKYMFCEDEIEDVIDLAREMRIKMSINDYEVAYLAAEKGEDLLCFDKQILSLTKTLKRKK